MATKIIYTRDDGGVSVVTPKEGLDLDFVIARSVPNGKPYEIIDSSELPDRVFRNAWERNGKKVGPNFQKAKGLARAKVKGDTALIQQINAAQTIEELKAVLDQI